MGLSVMALAGCAGGGGRWFEPSHPNPSQSSDTGSVPDAKSTAAAYIRSLCALPREQRQSQIRALNEALLPNNAAISCGRSGLE